MTPNVTRGSDAELVRRADQRRRWHEVGRVLFAGEPRWAPPLASYERWLCSRRHPYRRSVPGVELARFLVRRGGRIAVHHAEGDAVAWFGAFDAVDDAGVVGALVDAASRWAAERGASSLRGPALFTPADGDAGVLVQGFDHPGGTGRPWHPPWYAERLADAGFEPVGEAMPRWRLLVTAASTTDAAAGSAPGGPLPPHASRLADPALVLAGPEGAVAAVPDVSATARSTRLGRPPAPTEASVVRCEGDPALLVPALLAAAARRGYEAVWAPWSPWSPLDRPPDTVHRLVARRNRS